MLYDEIGKCIICGVQWPKPLCTMHAKYFRFVRKYGFYALKPHKKVSHPQDALYKNIKAVFRKPTFQEVIFEWNLFRRYDIVIPDLKLEIEYDGEQHFKFNKHFYHDKEDFKHSQEIDSIKEAAIRGNGYSVIRFSCIEDVDSREYVRKKLKLKGF